MINQHLTLNLLLFFFCFSASMRRSSLRGEKSNLFKKEAQEEALHFGLRLMQDEEELPVSCVHKLIQSLLTKISYLYFNSNQ